MYGLSIYEIKRICFHNLTQKFSAVNKFSEFSEKKKHELNIKFK